MKAGSDDPLTTSEFQLLSVLVTQEDATVAALAQRLQSNPEALEATLRGLIDSRYAERGSGAAVRATELGRQALSEQLARLDRHLRERE